MNSKKYQFVNNVKLVNPEYVIESNQLDFYTLSGLPFYLAPQRLPAKPVSSIANADFMTPKKIQVIL